MGQAPKGDTYNSSGEGVPLIAGAADLGPETPLPSKYTTKPTKFSANGDIIMCIRATIGDLNWADKVYCLGRGVAGLRANKEKLDPFYLWHVLLGSKGALSKHARGSTFKQISKDVIENHLVPLPELREQKRIAAILDKADELKRKRQKTIELSQNFLRSVFLDMFCGSTSDDWPIVKIEDVAAKTKGSMRTGPFGSDLLHSEFVEDGISVLGIDNAVSNEFKWRGRRFITQEKYEHLKRYTVNPGDVLITIMGTVGKSCIVPEDIGIAINTKHLVAITLDQKEALPEFIHAAFLLHPLISAQLRRSEKGAIMAGLNLGIIKSLEIPMPPISLQRKFKSITRQVSQHLERLGLSGDKLQNLADSLSGSLLKSNVSNSSEVDASGLKSMSG